MVLMKRQRKTRSHTKELPVRVIPYKLGQYVIETKVNKMTDREYEIYSFESIYGKEHIFHVIDLLNTCNLLKYQQYGIDINYEVSTQADTFILIKKPKQPNEFAYTNKLPEMVKLQVSTMPNVLENSDLYKLFTSLFVDIKFEGPTFRHKAFQDDPTIYNFMSWKVLGYGGINIASFSYTVMSDLTISRDRVLIRPLTAGSHLRRLNVDVLEKQALDILDNKNSI